MGFSSFLCDPSFAARATSCRRKVTSFSCMGTNSTDRTAKESCSDRTTMSKGDCEGQFAHQVTREGKGTAMTKTRGQSRNSFGKIH